MTYYIFFFNDTATTEIYTLSLHDALPIFEERATHFQAADHGGGVDFAEEVIWKILPDIEFAQYFERIVQTEDRKSTRLNSSHSQISYAVFCLKKKKKIIKTEKEIEYN